MHIGTLTVALTIGRSTRHYTFGFLIAKLKRRTYDSIKEKYQKMFDDHLKGKVPYKLKLTITSHKVESIDLSFWPYGSEAVINPKNNENDEKND